MSSSEWAQLIIFLYKNRLVYILRKVNFFHFWLFYATFHTRLRTKYLQERRVFRLII